MTDDELRTVARRIIATWPPERIAELGELGRDELRVVAWLVWHFDAVPVEADLAPIPMPERRRPPWQPAPPTDEFRAMVARAKGPRQ